MIRRVAEGAYTLFETRAGHKILQLNEKQRFAWIHTPGGYEILVATGMTDGNDHTLATGRYRLYDVKEEPDLSDQEHLELLAGERTWQGYLLPTGLPTAKKKRSSIIPTNERITKSTH